jgi:dissimilatory sulfite reductase (desulfoviridin) alpha/beta subunit
LVTLIILDMFKINKKSGKIGCEKKIAIINLDKCKPNTPAYQYLKRISKVCEKDCIQIHGKDIKILETACPICFNNAKRTPDRPVI